MKDHWNWLSARLSARSEVGQVGGRSEPVEIVRNDGETVFVAWSQVFFVQTDLVRISLAVVD